jgi:hypothetical protein
VTAYIQGTELNRYRKVTLSGFCVHCTLYNGIHLANFMYLFYTAQFSARPFLQSSELGPPSTSGECVPPSISSGGGGRGAHSPACEEVTLRS